MLSIHLIKQPNLSCRGQRTVSVQAALITKPGVCDANVLALFTTNATLEWTTMRGATGVT